jgi:hypothetical protein
MEEKKYTVMSDNSGNIYVDMGVDVGIHPPHCSIYRPAWISRGSIQRVNDPHNWKEGELVSDSDIEFLTGSGWIRRRVL